MLERICSGARRYPARRAVVVPVLVALLALSAALASCGQPKVVPAAGAAALAPVAQARATETVAGRLLFVRGGNVWLWSNGQESQLTVGGASTQPRWSPDGTAFLYVHHGESFADLWLATDLGRTVRQLTHNQAVGYQPETREYVLNSFTLTGPSWALRTSGGDRIVFSSDAGRDTVGLFLLDGTSGQPRAVHATDAMPGQIEGAAVAPGGAKIAFTYSTIDPQTYARSTAIYVVDVNTGEVRELATDPAGQYDAAWSPDGQWLSFTSRKGGGSNIWIMRADGSGQQRVTTGNSDRGATWSPDGNQLAYTHLQGDRWGLYVIDVNLAGNAPVAGQPRQIGNYADVDPASGVSWSR